jgi:hypothetical protein
MKLCKQYLKGWDWNLKGMKKRSDQIASELKKLEEIEESDLLNSNQIDYRCSLMTEILMMLDEEEIFWKQRAHENWLLHGDGNNEYFHRIANGRRRKNNIFFLEDGDRKIFGDENIFLHATEYYSGLFGPAPGNMFQIDREVWDGLEQLNELDNNVLCDHFSEKEIKEALFQMEKNKAAGPDSIPAEFYQICWDIVKNDIVSLFQDFHAGHLDVSRLNYGIITLLPKIKEATKIQQYRPICLLNCLYKLITKVLTIRIEPYA